MSLLKVKSTYPPRPAKSSSSSSSSSFASKKQQQQQSSCVNPVFEKWIVEWRDDAIARDLQSRHTYTKCLSSLRKYPLPMQSGKECKILEGFGDKICKQIDDNLKDFLAAGGQLHDENVDSGGGGGGGLLSAGLCRIDDDDEDDDQLPQADDNDSDVLIEYDTDDNRQPQATQPTSKSKATTTKAPKTSKQQTPTYSEDYSPTTQQQSQQSQQSQSTQSGRSKRTQKEYLPEFRTGPYSLLVALFTNEQVDFFIKSPTHFFPRN